MNIIDYWTTFFGIDPEAFDTPGIHLVPHASLDDYWGLWLFVRDKALIVSSPDSFLPICEKLLLDSTPATLSDPEVVSRHFKPYVERIIGPAYHGSLTAEDFTPVKTATGHEISFEQTATLDDGSDPTGWDWSGCGNDKDHYFGVFQDGTLAAVSNYEIKNDVVAFPGVFVHPNHRGHGLAKSALSLTFQHSLDAGLMMDYQTLCENTGAIRAAESLGVKQMAQHIAIRLKAI